MSTPNPAGRPLAPLYARRASKTKNASEAAVPWMKITIGGTIAFQVIIGIFALFALSPGERKIQTEDGLPPLPRVKDPVALAAPVVKVADPKQVDAIDDAPAFQNEFVDCARIGTQVRFMKEPAEAFQRARAEKKMVFVVHLSGNLEDKDFT